LVVGESEMGLDLAKGSRSDDRAGEDIGRWKDDITGETSGSE